MNIPQWAVESEVYRKDATVKRRAECRTFATRSEASTWLKEQVQKWTTDKNVTAYVARGCRWHDGQWVPVAVRHNCRQNVMKGAITMTTQNAAVLADLEDSDRQKAQTIQMLAESERSSQIAASEKPQILPKPEPGQDAPKTAPSTTAVAQPTTDDDDCDDCDTEHDCEPMSAEESAWFADYALGNGWEK